MENSKERVLAYTLAKEITPEELTRISGGGAPSGAAGPSGGYYDGNGRWHISFDASIDW